MQKILVSKAQLKADYIEMKVTDICKKYDVCLARLYRMLDECGIERKWDKAPRKEVREIIYKD